MSAILKFVLSYPKEIGTALAIGGLVLLGWGYVQERDNRIAAEAVAEVRLEDFQTVDQAYRKVTTETQETLAKLEQERLALASKLETAEEETERLAEVADEASQQAIETGQTLGQTLRAIDDSIALEQWREHLSADQQTRRAHREELEAVEEERDLWKDAARLANEWGSVQYNQRVAAEAALDEARDALEARVQTEGEPWYEHWTVDVAKVVAAFEAGRRVGEAW